MLGFLKNFLWWIWTVSSENVSTMFQKHQHSGLNAERCLCITLMRLGCFPILNTCSLSCSVSTPGGANISLLGWMSFEASMKRKRWTEVCIRSIGLEVSLPLLLPPLLTEWDADPMQGYRYPQDSIHRYTTSDSSLLFNNSNTYIFLKKTNSVSTWWH